MNKYQVAVVTPAPAVPAKPPRIAACLTHIECGIVDTLETGDQAVGKSADDSGHYERCGRAGNLSILMGRCGYKGRCVV